MTDATTPEQPDLAAIRQRQQKIAGVVKYPSFRLMSDEWATISADLNALLNMVEAQARPAVASEGHTHALYDCGGKGHGSDASEVQWCHDCTPHAPAVASEGLPNAVAGVKGFVSRPLADRLWEKVQIAEGCWLWRGATRSPDPERAYGIIWVDGAHRPAAKVMWELAHGKPFPEGMDALHTCDNPPCVNPLHIFPGTPRDNAIDMVRKGRHGNQVGGTHLTETDVLEIRSSGLTVNELAAKFAVGDDAIRLILSRETWRHV